MAESNPLVSPPALSGSQKKGPELNVGSGGPQKPIANDTSSPPALPSVLGGVSPSQNAGNPIGVGSIGNPGRPFRV